MLKADWCSQEAPWIYDFINLRNKKFCLKNFSRPRGTATASHDRSVTEARPGNAIPGANCKAGGKQGEQRARMKNWPWLLSCHRQPALLPFLRLFSILKSRKPMKNKAHCRCPDLFLQHLQRQSGFLPAQELCLLSTATQNELSRFSGLGF